LLTLFASNINLTNLQETIHSQGWTSSLYKSLLSLNDQNQIIMGPLEFVTLI